MNAILHRALVAFTGMPDEPPRFMRGDYEDGEGDPSYRSAMVGGDCEFLGDVAPDDQRVIKAPIRTRAEEESFAFWRRWSLHIAVAAIGGLVLLLKLCGARSLS